MLLLLISVLDVIFAPRGIGAQSVTQPDAHVTVSEEAALELRCNYSYGGTPYLYWYVQYPNEGLQLLLRYFSGNTLVKGIKGFEAEFRKTESSFHLRKHSAHGSDTAKYFCAVSDTVSGTAGGAEHKPPETLGLFVTQDLKREFPQISSSVKKYRAGQAGLWETLYS
uniref:Ig-like domain-containing protein n=1 Tax=Neovison vison TaxID=452646 RepID=A0A8C7BM52_NEOVI